MPTFKQNREAFTDAVEKNAIIPVTNAPPPQVPIPVADYPAAPNSFLRTPLPALSVQQPDMQRQWQTGAVSQARISPASVTGNAVAAAQAISQTIITKGGSGPLLETNNQANNSQGVLNLISGANVSLSADAQGGVTITSTGGTSDGLTHGDAIWELDPAWMILRDDFNNPNAIPSPSATFGNGLNWTILTGGTTTPVLGGPFPLNGVIATSNSTSANSMTAVRLFVGGSSAGNGYPLLDYPGWKTVWTFQISRNNSSLPGTFSWTKVSLYVGLGSYISGNPTNASSARPPSFLGLRYDTDATAPAISDTQFVFEYVNNLTSTPLTRINTQGTTFATGMTVTEGRIYRFEMSCVTSGQILFFLTDGVTTVSNTMAVGQISFSGNQPSFTTSNGTVLTTWGGGNQIPIELGTKVTISGGSISAGNGTFVHGIPRGATNELFFLTGTTISGIDTGATTAFFPGLAPMFHFGNDSQATPTGNSKGVLIDYFGLVWNKGLQSGGYTPNSTLPRY